MRIVSRLYPSGIAPFAGAERRAISYLRTIGQVNTKQSHYAAIARRTGTACGMKRNESGWTRRLWLRGSSAQMPQPGVNAEQARDVTWVDDAGYVSQQARKSGVLLLTIVILSY